MTRLEELFPFFCSLWSWGGKCLLGLDIQATCHDLLLFEEYLEAHIYVNDTQN